jgi:hypothetical protein
MRPDFPFPQVTTGDLDIAVLRQLPPSKLALGDEFEPGPVKVVGFQTPFGCWGLIEQGLEHAPGDTHCAFILAEPRRPQGRFDRGGRHPFGTRGKKRHLDNPDHFHRRRRPVGAGLVASLAQPGGNLTGFSSFAVELNPKRFELLSELFLKPRLLLCS